MKRYNKNEIDELAEILKNDGVISVPTDTVYGLCARINSFDAMNNLAKIKKRPNDKVFPIMCADINQIKDIAIVDEKVEKLINVFMPGPITLILRKKEELPEYINTNTIEIGIRMATSETLKNLILKVESPIFMTSANRTGEPPCTTLDEIEDAFPNLNSMLEGDVTFGESSTIVYCITDDIKILREGPISEEEIRKVLRN